MAAATDITGNYVDSVTVGASGLITVSFGNDANLLLVTGDPTFTLQGDESGGGSVLWACGGTILDKYKPASCRP